MFGMKRSPLKRRRTRLSIPFGLRQFSYSITLICLIEMDHKNKEGTTKQDKSEQEVTEVHKKGRREEE